MKRTTSITTFYGLIAATSYGLGLYAAGQSVSDLQGAAQFLIASGVFIVAFEIRSLREQAPKDPA